jgi:methylmalonyl-CoA/ethylmalonyl-CoA epimerase
MFHGFELGAINHVGVAVPDVKKAAERYHSVFNIKDISELIELPSQGVKVIFVNTPAGQVELIEPLGDNSPIKKFLEKNPLGGQHHLCFEVADIHEAKAEMEAKGVRVLNEPRIGAHGTPIIFLNPKDMGGVLIELMETPGNEHG